MRAVRTDLLQIGKSEVRSQPKCFRVDLFSIAELLGRRFKWSTSCRSLCRLGLKCWLEHDDSSRSLNTHRVELCGSANFSSSKTEPKISSACFADFLRLLLILAACCSDHRMANSKEEIKFYLLPEFYRTLLSPKRWRLKMGKTFFRRLPILFGYRICLLTENHRSPFWPFNPFASATSPAALQRLASSNWTRTSSWSIKNAPNGIQQ